MSFENCNKKTGCIESIVPFETISSSPSFGSVVPLKDEKLLWAYTKPLWKSGKVIRGTLMGSLSSDEGRTWGENSALKLKSGGEIKSVSTTSLARLSSGALGIAFISKVVGEESFPAAQRDTVSFAVSGDEGKTWSEPTDINPVGSSAHPANDRCLVLADGRITVPVYTYIGPKPLSENPKESLRFGHGFHNAFASNFAYSYVYYSDDEGMTWQRSRNETYVALEKGTKGSYTMGEPAVIELKDGRLMMLGRNDLGRFFRSYSEDHGQTWCEAEPTDLACYPAPCSLRRIPETQDLLVIWNQISPWETMNGLYRHRLTCAISKDEGQTWQNHKNLESLDDVNHIEPCPPEYVLIGKTSQPIDRERYHLAPGPLRYNQPTCTFLNGRAIITYGCTTLGDPSVIAKTYGMDFEALATKLGLTRPDPSKALRGVNKVRVLPTDWFYN